MGDLFLDIENTIFHVLLKQGVGEKYFEGDIFIISQFYQFTFFLVVPFFFFFFLRGVGFVGSTENFNYL